MNREITEHKINDCNSSLCVAAIDEPGPGGANHKYLISSPANPGKNDGVYCELNFQNGAIKESGTNGITHEALLAVLVDRFEAFQRGPYACDENGHALSHLKCVQAFLKGRTERRTKEGVEGTMKV